MKLTNILLSIQQESTYMKTVPLGPVNDHGISCHQYEPLSTLMTCRGMLKGDAITEAGKMMCDTDTLQ